MSMKASSYVRGVKGVRGTAHTLRQCKCRCRCRSVSCHRRIGESLINSKGDLLDVSAKLLCELRIQLHIPRSLGHLRVDGRQMILSKGNIPRFEQLDESFWETCRKSPLYVEVVWDWTTRFRTSGGHRPCFPTVIYDNLTLQALCRLLQGLPKW